MSPDIDLVVLTLDEEENLPFCLASVEGAVRNIFIVDSGSSDSTIAIAEQAGAKVFHHDFVTQAEQLNWALDNLPFESGWILRLDGDEYLTPELREELPRAVASASRSVSGFYIKRRLIFLGRWIRHGTYYPTWILRLWRTGQARSEEIVFNEHMILSDGHARKLKHDLVDHDRHGLKSWLTKHQGYAERHIAFIETIKDPGGMALPPRLTGTQAQRRRWTEANLYGRAPLFVRCAIYFIYRYVLRLGFLDGVPGIVFHFLHGFWYRFYIDARIWEVRRRAADDVSAGDA